MSVTVTGVDWKAYYSDQTAWPEDTTHEDTLVEINGAVEHDTDLEAVKDTDCIVVQRGIIVFASGPDADMVQHLTQWLAARDTLSVIFTAPKEKLEAVKAAVRAAGGWFPGDSVNTETSL